MSEHMPIATAAQRSVLRAEEREYRRIYLASFVLFLLVVVVLRLVPRQWRILRVAEGARKSILAETRETAHAAIAFAFI